MVENGGKPKYLQLADELRRKIVSGSFPVGATLPSASELTELWDASSVEVRAVDGLVFSPYTAQTNAA
ncbi:GntR family transcriptional regulator [Cryptosporangium minutisporangium]|uniref:HTH gntR-type domain-containing protein n=1 Tax=Cryptosporangium minutisporangium TaxID=113569 RepID=A0ABP6STH0_9ACTN